MNELDLLKLHLLNSIEQNLDGFVFYQLLVDEQGKASFLFLSEQITKYNSHPIEEIKKNPNLLYEKVHSDYLEDLLEKQQNSRRNLEKFHVEFPIYISDHEFKWLSVTSVPVKTENNGVLWNGVQIDITEKKRQENKINKQNRILKLLNSVNDKVLETNDNNRLLEKVTKCIVEQGSYKLVWIALMPEPNSTDQMVKVHSAFGEVSYLNDIRINLNDEKMKNGPTASALLKGCISVTNNMTKSENFKPWLEKASKHGLRSSVVFPLKIVDQAAAINIYSHEIDAFNDEEIELLERIIKNINNALHNNHLEAQKAIADELLQIKIKELEYSEANLQTVFNHTKIRYSLLDRNFNVLMFNDGFKRDFEALNSKNINIGDCLLDLLEKERKAELLEMIELLKDKTFPYAEYEIKYQYNSQEVYTTITYFPVFINDQLSSFLIVSEDISQRKKYEQERQQMIDDLIIRNIKLEKFAFIVSHVLRAPIANIMGLNTLIKEDPNNTKKYLDLLNESILKLDQVVKELNETLQKTNNASI